MPAAKIKFPYCYNFLVFESWVCLIRFNIRSSSQVLFNCWKCIRVIDVDRWRCYLFDCQNVLFLYIQVCTKLNRYGNQTKSTGSLTVANRIILQRDVNFFADNSNGHKATVSLGFTEQNGTTVPVSKQISVDDVVVAYQKAKQRLEATTLMR